MNLDWIDDQEYYSDKDCAIFTFYVGKYTYTISKLKSGKFLVDYDYEDIHFEVESINIGHRIMKNVLGV